MITESGKEVAVGMVNEVLATEYGLLYRLVGSDQLFPPDDLRLYDVARNVKGEPMRR